MIIADQATADSIPHWVDWTDNIPEGALKAGHAGNESLYIGRAMHCRAMTPGNQDSRSMMSNSRINFQEASCRLRTLFT